MSIIADQEIVMYVIDLCEMSYKVIHGAIGVDGHMAMQTIITERVHVLHAAEWEAVI